MDGGLASARTKDGRYIICAVLHRTVRMCRVETTILLFFPCFPSIRVYTLRSWMEGENRHYCMELVSDTTGRLAGRKCRPAKGLVLAEFRRCGAGIFVFTCVFGRAFLFSRSFVEAVRERAKLIRYCPSGLQIFAASDE